jgi:hypothetical protein
MVDRGKNPLRRTIVRRSLVALALLCLVLAGGGLGLFVSQDREDYTKVALDQSPFLRDVSEPILIVKAISNAGSDDHWQSVTFRDAKQVEREAKFVFYYPESGPYPETRNILFLDGKRVPAGGREEQAFLGLLQRWFRQDPEARELFKRLERRDPSLRKSWSSFGEVMEKQEAKLVAIMMMRVLLRRD